MRSSIFKAWQWFGDRMLGAAGRATQFEGGERSAAGAVVPGERIRPSFQVIAGGKSNDYVAPVSRPVGPAGPSKPMQRAS